VARFGRVFERKQPKTPGLVTLGDPAPLWPGRVNPLGATLDDKGVNFAVYSERAEGLQLCLYDPSAPNVEIARHELALGVGHVWHGYVPGLKAGALYGFRARGPFEPAKGLRFNPSKLLVDPYAKALHGKVNWKAPVLGYKKDVAKDPDLTSDDRDSASGVPRGVVVDTRFDWGDDESPSTPLHRTLLYELHVKGFTQLHPGVPRPLQGSYLGLGQPAVIEHLQSLGVTAVELLPVHETVDEGFLSEKGFINYWGYSTLGFFAPEQRWSGSGTRGEQVTEFKQMVKALHAAGIEVILDVVYNHTCEGNHLGPTLSLRGLDNTTYYKLKSDDPRYYMDFTGTGNSVNTRHPQALKLIVDSLRYWVEDMHVDGFRFDLATTLGREVTDYDRQAAFFRILHQDPVLSTVKLIAEPWDVGMGGYQVGNFPAPWAEWNGKYRDGVRRYWKGDEHQVAEIGYRLTGSSDLFALSGRAPFHSINFITAHDGFTLHDLVSYNHKHNEANLEQNRDGSSDNDSWNCGAEGPTDDAAILKLREQQKRNFLTTLFLSQGTPMLVAGDEMGRTQKGNNNGYCQDNELSWVHWTPEPRGQALFDFTRTLSRLRREHPVFARRRFFRGVHMWDSNFKDLAWFRADGAELTKEDWAKEPARALGFLLGGDAIGSPDVMGRRIVDDTFLVLMNPTPQASEFRLPAVEWGQDWELVIDTAQWPLPAHARVPAGQKISLVARSMLVLRHPSMTLG
jgi:isoamylase